MGTATEEVVETDAGDKRGLRPNHMILGLWVGVAIITVISGFTSWIFDFHHDDDAVTRVVWLNVPPEIKVIFYSLVPALLIYTGLQLSHRVKNWQRGAPENRKTTSKNIKQRLEDMRAGLYMQTLMRDPVAGIMHSMIYFGFLILMAVTTTLEIDHQLPEILKFLTVVSTRATHSSATPPVSCSSLACCGHSVAASVLARCVPIASASRTSPNTL